MGPFRRVENLTGVVDGGLMWGDAGCLYFRIRRDDLEARRFDQAWLILQCY